MNTCPYWIEYGNCNEFDNKVIKLIANTLNWTFQYAKWYYKNHIFDSYMEYGNNAIGYDENGNQYFSTRLGIYHMLLSIGIDISI